MRKKLILAVVFLFLLGTGPVGAAVSSEQVTSLTINEAITRALNLNPELRAAAYAIDQAYERREDSADAVKWVPTADFAHGDVGGVANPASEMAAYGLAQADLGWRVQKKNYAAKEKAVRLDVYQKYVAVQQAQKKVKTAEAGLKREQEAIKVVRAQQMVGMASQPQVVAAETSYEEAKKNLEAAREALDKAYVAFNRLVGLSPQDRPVLTEEILFTPLQADNVEVETERAVEASETLAQLRMNIDIQKTDTMMFSKPYDVEKYDVDIAKLNLTDAEKKLREQVHTLVNDIRALEEQYAAAQAAVKAGEEQLRVTRVKYNVGMATQSELVAAEVALTEAKDKLFSITYQHASQCAYFRYLTGRPVA